MMIDLDRILMDFDDRILILIMICICLSEHVPKHYFPVRRAVSLIYIFDFVCFSSGRKCFGEKLACSNQIWHLNFHENLVKHRFQRDNQL